MHWRTHQRRGRGAAIGIVALVGVMGIGLTGVTASVAGAAAAKSPANYKNKLSNNTKGWCTPAQGCNGVGGNAADYGTINIVKPSDLNSGGYASSIAAPAGQRKFARATGAGIDQDGPTGCPQAGYDAALNSPYCEGPYVLYGGSGSDSVFPANGFNSSIKIYIDAAWAHANPGQNLEWDVGLNNTSGQDLNDNGFTLCSESSGTGGFYVNLNQYSGCNPSPEVLTTSGWYTFQQNFQSVGGNITVTYTLTPPTGPVWTSVVNTGLPTSGTGGPNYGWLAAEDIQGLPVADISLHRN